MKNNFDLKPQIQRAAAAAGVDFLEPAGDTTEHAYPVDAQDLTVKG